MNPVITSLHIINSLKLVQESQGSDDGDFSIRFSDRSNKTISFLRGINPRLYRKVDEFITSLFEHSATTRKTESSSKSEDNYQVFYKVLPDYLYIDRIEIFIPNDIPESVAEDVLTFEDSSQIEVDLYEFLEHISEHLAGSSDLIEGITISSRRDSGSIPYEGPSSNQGPFRVGFIIRERYDIYQIILESFELDLPQRENTPRVLDLRVFYWINPETRRLTTPFMDWMNSITLKLSDKAAALVLLLAEQGHRNCGLTRRDINSSKKTWEIKFSGQRIYYCLLQDAILFVGGPKKEQEDLINVITKTWEPLLLKDSGSHSGPIHRNRWGL
jgi:hypothetical protein